jgi:hypothetical protein
MTFAVEKQVSPLRGLRRFGRNDTSSGGITVQQTDDASAFSCPQEGG